MTVDEMILWVINGMARASTKYRPQELELLSFWLARPRCRPWALHSWLVRLATILDKGFDADAPLLSLV